MYPPEIIIKHLRDDQSIIPRALPQIALLVAEWQSIAPFYRLQYPKNKELQLTEEAIKEHLTFLDYKLEHGVWKSILLSNTDGKYPVNLAVSYYKPIKLEKVQVLIHPRFPQETLQFEQIVKLIAQMGVIFEAYTGYLFDLSLAKFNENFSIPMTTFDSSKVPYGLWWVNYWSNTQVETVGRQKIRNADWHKLYELPNGSIIGLVTEIMTDLANPQHKTKLTSLSKYFDLREIQELYRLSEPNTDTPC
jgi:hypothetical protein